MGRFARAFEKSAILGRSQILRPIPMGFLPERGELFEEVAADKLVYDGELFQERGRSFLDVQASPCQGQRNKCRKAFNAKRLIFL